MLKKYKIKFFMNKIKIKLNFCVLGVNFVTTQRNKLNKINSITINLFYIYENKKLHAKLKIWKLTTKE